MTTSTKSKSPKSLASKSPAPKSRKSAAPPAPPEVPTTTPAIEDDEPTAYSLTAQVQAHGAATADEVFALIDRDRTSLIEDGAQVATARIDTDCARIYGRASDFYKTATPAQRRALRGLSMDIMRVVIWAARQGQTLYEQRRLAESAGAGRQEQRQTQAAALRQQGLITRQQLATLLRQAAGGNEQRLADIVRAYGRISTPEELAQALAELVKLGQKYAGASDAALKRRAATAGLDAAYLQECAALAGRVADQLKTAEATREAPLVSQADIDLWDGVNLYLLGSVIELFAVGNQIDPTVPRLMPISLRSWFVPSRKPKTAAPEPTPPAV
jgi:hypothetical protein